MQGSEKSHYSCNSVKRKQHLLEITGGLEGKWVSVSDSKQFEVNELFFKLLLRLEILLNLNRLFTDTSRCH